MSIGILEAAINDSGKMIREGVPGPQILTLLAQTAEKIVGKDSVASILVLDKEGLLRNGASPRLPIDYLKAIDGLRPSPLVGTCAAAAATGLVTITSDFRDDDKWAELRHLPLSLGFISAWSVPIKSAEGKVLGTFGTYYRERRKPNESEIAAVTSLANAAANVLRFAF